MIARRAPDAAALLLLLLLVAPALGLVVGTSPGDVAAALADPRTASALWLSLRTTLLAVVVVVGLGTPLAWRLSRAGGRRARWVEVLVELPVVLPPAVVGVALLETFGRAGLFGPALGALGVSLPFTATAVVLAQVVVAGPLYVQSATAAFRGVDDDLVLVARTLGAPPLAVTRRVIVPAALPGLLTGVALCWARALGEFGATLLFAGSLPGRTQTLPLLVFSTLERDVGAARAVSLLLLLVAVAVLVGLRFVPRHDRVRSGQA